MAEEIQEKKESVIDEKELYSSYDDSTKKKKKGRSWVTIVLFCLFLGIFIYSGTNIIIEQLNNRSTSNTVEDLKKIRLEYEGSIEKGENSETRATLLDPDADYTNPEEWGHSGSSTTDKTFEIILDEIGENVQFLIADLTTCKNLNSDTRAWLKFDDVTSDVAGLPIDLPVVKCPKNDQNSFYLNHNFYQEYNVNGWVFFDYRNDVSDITKNRNLILYGHARSDNMFGGLKYLNEKSKWYNNKENHYIYIKTDNVDTIWQIFSWYETDVEVESASIYNYIRTDFYSDESFIAFCNSLQDKNQISAFSKFEFTADDHILTMSTCKSYDKNVRVAVHAKLVKLRVWS